MKKWWVAGSRSITNYTETRRIFDMFINKSDTIRTGGAIGVDRLAEEWARKNGVKMESSILPDWRIGRHAGFLRNTEGVEWCDAVLVIWDGKSRGSAHVIKEAKRLGKDIIGEIY